ncbi:MAG: hypothetical protein SPL22_08990 [Treponema sp.]|uniref:hypothetical protein n=1 Tax=Treponema sp. TaxID=166 RepID=UPI002A9099B7|nr:hypothetical protein [Treponema sp.]MDY6397856.1 hypothetical protein [Treponema sp.]
MKVTLKNVFAVISALAIAQSVFALETGGLLTNDSKFLNAEKDGSLKLDQKNGINLWFRNPVSQDGSSYIAGEGSFLFEKDMRIEDSEKQLKLYADLNLLKLVAKKELESGNLVFSAGRFYNSDLSGLVYTQNGDGVKLEASLSGVEFSVFGAYTGLLNAKNITILGNDTDLTDKEKTVYVMANKFAVGALTLSLPYFAANQTLSIEGVGALSLESTKFNRFYGTVALNGPLFTPVFYNISSTMGFAKYDEEDMVKGNLTKGAISVYPDFKSMSFSLNGLYASGKQGSFEAFQGFTSNTAVNSLKEDEYSGIALAGISASIKPVENFLFFAGADIVFDTLAGEEQKNIERSGLQYSAGFNWQVVSDVSLGANLTQFIGKDDYADYNRTQFRITAAIAF